MKPKVITKKQLEELDQMLKRAIAMKPRKRAGWVFHLGDLGNCIMVLKPSSYGYTRVINPCGYVGMWHELHPKFQLRFMIIHNLIFT